MALLGAHGLRHIITVRGTIRGSESQRHFGQNYARTAGLVQSWPSELTKPLSGALYFRGIVSQNRHHKVGGAIVKLCTEQNTIWCFVLLVCSDPH